MTMPAVRTRQVSESRAGATLLTDEMLARFAARAPRYDAENRFAAEDFAAHRLLEQPLQ